MTVPCPATLVGSEHTSSGTIVLLIVLILLFVVVLAGIGFVWWRRKSVPPSLQYGVLDDNSDGDDQDGSNDYITTHGVASASNDADFTD
jgi:flagellar basal body-associated protein FliL